MITPPLIKLTFSLSRVSPLNRSIRNFSWSILAVWFALGFPSARATELKSPVFTRPMNGVKGILLHQTESNQFENILSPGNAHSNPISDFFKNMIDPSNEVGGPKCHFFIDGIGQLVAITPLNWQAYHAGESYYHGEQGLNSNHVGIEVRGLHDKPVNNLQLRALRKLLVALRSGHGPDAKDIALQTASYQHWAKQNGNSFHLIEPDDQGVINQENIISHVACALFYSGGTYGRKNGCGTELSTPRSRNLLGLPSLIDHPEINRCEVKKPNGQVTTVYRGDHEVKLTKKLKDGSQKCYSHRCLTMDQPCVEYCETIYQEFGAPEVCEIPPTVLTQANWRNQYEESDSSFDKALEQSEGVERNHP